MSVITFQLSVYVLFDVFHLSSRRPLEGVSYVKCHDDGFDGQTPVFIFFVYCNFHVPVIVSVFFEAFNFTQSHVVSKSPLGASQVAGHDGF